MSKKLAEGIDGLLLDIKTGDGAFMRDRRDAKKLAATMKDIGLRAGKKMTVLLTDMSEPLGRSAGHTLEVAESIAVLRGENIPQVTELTLRQAAELMVAFGMADSIAAGRKKARGKLADGTALSLFRQLVERQGGDPRVIDDPALLAAAPHSADIVADRDGYLAGVGARAVGKALVALGGGRIRAEDAIDPAVGMTFPKKAGDPVVKGEPIVRIHYRDETRLSEVKAAVRAAITLSATPPLPKKTVQGRI
jgi:pyrimidine-nucleoside phosphorylase